MRRRLIQLSVCVVVGAILTVLGAWTFALYGALGAYTITYKPPAPGSRLSSASRVPADFVEGSHVTRESPRGGLRYELVTEMVWLGSRLAWMEGRQNRSVERVAAGWPLPALEWVGDLDLRHDDKGWNVYEGLKPPFRAGDLSQGADRRLPLVPLWPGFVVNALAYAVVPFAGWTLFLRIRERRRRRAGRCVGCGYELGGFGQCPECGRAAAG